MVEIINFLSEPVNPKYSLGERKGFGETFEKKRKQLEEKMEEAKRKEEEQKQKRITKKTSEREAQQKRQKYKQMRAYKKYLTITPSQENLIELERQKEKEEEETTRRKQKEEEEEQKKIKKNDIAILNYEDLVNNGLDRYRANPFISGTIVDEKQCMFWVADLEKKDEFSKKYRIQEQIGEGTYGRVYRVSCKRTQEDYVAKVLLKNEIRCLGMSEYMKREIDINKIYLNTKVANKHVTKFVEAIETDTSYYLIFEYIIGKSLMSRKNMPIARETIVRSYFIQILEALAYIHDTCGVFHGDLQLANIMKTDETQDVKLIDFGCANYIDRQKAHQSFSGNLYFAAPELLSGQHYAGDEIDIWSAGVCLYKMLTGYLPFEKAADAVRARFTEPLEEDDSLNDEVKDLFRSIFNIQGHLRPSASQLLTHPWCLMK